MRHVTTCAIETKELLLSEGEKTLNVIKGHPLL